MEASENLGCSCHFIFIMNSTGGAERHAEVGDKSCRKSWSAGGEAPVARLAKRTREADHNLPGCLSVTRPHFSQNSPQNLTTFCASAQLEEAIRNF